MPTVTTVDEYIEGFPTAVRERLRAVQATIATAVPGVSEIIRYGMPAAMLGDRYLVHYAGWKQHIGMYPIPVFEGDLELEVAAFRAAKDAIQLRHRQPLPLDLLARIVAEIVARRD